MSQNSRMHWDPTVSMASATALLFTKGQQADLSSRGRKEAQGVTTARDAWRVHAPPYFAAAWTCVCGSKDSKRQSCCPIYKPGANLTAFYFFWCCCQRELIQIMFQVTIQHWAWGRVLKSCPPPPCQTAECFINLKQPPQHSTQDVSKCYRAHWAKEGISQWDQRRTRLTPSTQL